MVVEWFRVLSPGEYRILGSPAPAKPSWTSPAFSIAPATERITLDHAGVQDVHLKLTGPLLR
jgi:hypothetical protein